MNLSQPIKILIALIFVTVVLTFDQLTTSTEPKHIKELKVAKTVDPNQLTCMAKNIFYEAGSESLNGQAAVARVVMNRIAYGFCKNPCDVIYQASIINKVVDDEIHKVKLCQFSWVCEGKGEPNKNSPKYKQAEQVAYNVLAYDEYAEIVPKTALFFHNLSVDPLWPYKQVAKIGNHIFYSKTKKSTQKTAVNNDNNI
jgi:spore germination cell wall hydrolase CwlJ-like protein